MTKAQSFLKPKRPTLYTPCCCFVSSTAPRLCVVRMIHLTGGGGGESSDTGMLADLGFPWRRDIRRKESGVLTKGVPQSTHFRHCSCGITVVFRSHND